MQRKSVFSWVVIAAAAGLIWLVTLPLAPAGHAGGRPTGELSKLLPRPSLDQSLADEYGQAIVAELARLMSRRTDAACLKSRNLAATALRKGAANILLRYGRRAHAIRHPKVDPAKVEAVFLKIAGSQALADLRKFAADGTAQQYQRIAEPVRRDNIVLITADDFDRYLDNANLSLGQTLAPISSGNVELTKVALRREELFHKALQAEISKDAAMRRFIKHLDAFDSAEREVVLSLYKGVKPESTAYTAFAGVEADLRNFCVQLGK